MTQPKYTSDGDLFSKSVFHGHGIKVPEPEESKRFEQLLGMAGDCCTTTTTGSSFPKISIDDILKARDELIATQPVLKIWTGDRSKWERDLKPSINCDSNLDPEMAYIVAGVGIIAGSYAYSQLRCARLEWVYTSEEATDLK